MNNRAISSLSVKAVYLLTYIVQALLLGYLVLYFLDKTDLPLGVVEGEVFELVGFCILLPILCHSCLYFRYRFDLVKMCDGTSVTSRFIWTVLALSMNLGLLHVVLRDIVQVY